MPLSLTAMKRCLSTASAVFLSIALSGVVQAAEPLCFRGVNLSGGEYGDKGGVYGTNYIYPTDQTIRYFAGKGMNAVRLPIKWERLQPVLNQRLNAAELQRLHETVAAIRRSGMTVILDPHNYAYYEKTRLGTPDLPLPVLADFWARLAVEFADDSGVVFGLMNEPYDIPGPEWLDAANQSIVAIRNVKAQNLILVPGTIWSGASSWSRDIPGGANAKVMLGVKDPANHYAYEFHQYMDGDFSGQHPTCENAKAATKALSEVSDWLRKNGKRGFLGEFGGSKDKACLKGLADMTGTITRNSDVWIGWTYWAAGEWWPVEEPLNIQPRSAKEPAQLSALRPALTAGPADPDRCQAQ